MHTNTYSLAPSLTLIHTHTHIRCYHGDVLCLHTKIRATHLMMCVSVEQYNYGFVIIPNTSDTV